LLDVLLALNISAGLVLLLVSLYLVNPLEISVFPSLLLILTLFRLGLNIASTRLILGEAYAGKIISAFGSFVVKGNYVVGFIIFLILIIIQFLVIVKGAGRISEVAARFTLDAMPGKQMSIDADLNAGLLTETEARERRLQISREADFYGAMDGASKFVKGDAIAGLIITSVNIVAGLIIGVLQMGMPISEALTTYALLTIGDGLVSQIPALLVSTSAGIVVTRAASEDNLSTDLQEQIFAKPKALFIASGALLMFSLTPGLPTIPFLILASVIAAVAFSLTQQKEAEEELEAASEEAELPAPADNIEHYLQVDPLELEIGYNLIPLVDAEQEGDLFERITSMRKQLAVELGIIVPPIRVRDNLQLNPDEYVVKIRGNEITSNEVMMGRLLAMNPGHVEDSVSGVEVVEPAFGLPAIWIDPEQRHEAELAGYTVVETSAVLATHLMELIRKNADKLLGRQEVKQLLDNLKKDYPAVVEELIPDQMGLGAIQKVLQNLLREHIPIRDLVTILETLADYAGMTKNVEVLTEYVRFAMSDTIAKLFQDENEIIHAITLDPKIEQLITNTLQKQKQVTN
ncbi:flagellar biosynthesis protein FlhA, partial [candidate division KSB1 bacterium]|nr:flagellar biosynthesis protein FlhA [candidate division KSB1 bacterium]NIV70076.1 flagellar biosynthesis protein FlhA [Phycisphaerae bacterium]NIS26013.1 flagellar biosynthesis protein FlhA [candidate division KSB1 bacterium]NIT72835.1 flagellar biosynthesis protein FlhA [candidate division KSB1 bacterium]NIU26678.1 flagellar biosynthesis protein FlhA [candidate division KSB1 bacterium]